MSKLTSDHLFALMWSLGTIVFIQVIGRAVLETLTDRQRAHDTIILGTWVASAVAVYAAGVLLLGIAKHGL